MATSFIDFLKEKDKDQASVTPAQPLKDFANQITEYLGAPAKCEIVLGGIVNYGQEYRAVMTFPPLDYAQNLFRVYLSLTDQKITFHPTGGKLERDVKDLNARLFDLLKEPGLMETLRYIKEKSRQFREEGRVS